MKIKFFNVRYLACWSWLLLLVSSFVWAEADFQKIETRIHPTENFIGYLKIDPAHSIGESTCLYVKFALEEYRQKGVTFVLLDLDTPGGEVFAAMKIAKLLQQLDMQDQIPVVAWIDHWAISAGAMLAYASRFIGVTPTASMGAAEPVLASAEGKMETASEKVNSALRAEFANLASFYGRNALIAEAMVDKEILLVLRNGEVVRLEQEGEIEPSDTIIVRKGQLLTLNAEQLMTYQVADFTTPPSKGSLSKAGEWPASESPLFQVPFFAKIPGAKIIAFHSWKVDFFSFLSHPLVSSLLFMGLLLGVYAEMSHPGFGFPAILALTCLGLILLSSFASEAAGMLELIILGLGLLLLAIEIFVLPGFGWTGVLGILLTLVGLFTLMVPMGGGAFTWDTSQWGLAAGLFAERAVYFAVTLLLSVIIIGILARYLTPLFLKKSPLILKEDQEGFSASEFDHQMIGKVGEVVTELKPAGHIMIEGALFPALSEAGFIDKGKTVKVVGGRGFHLIVR